MKHKIIAAIGALALTGGTFSAVAQTSTVNKGPSLEEAVAFCRAVGQNYMEGNRNAFANAFARVKPEYRQPLSVVCYAYAAGFDDGRASYRRT